MSKFTPGTWSSSIDPDGVVICSGAYDIAQIVDNDNVKQQDADAKLIAAAPEMYKILKTLYEEPVPIGLTVYDPRYYKKMYLMRMEIKELLKRIDGKESKNED